VRSITRVAIALLMGAFALTACGSSKTATPETPIKGGVLREGLVQLGSSDPAKAQTVSERQMADQLYDGLTAWDPTSLTAIPSLAQTWESTPDQMHWTFHLRPAQASNGDQINATDVKRSLEHIARKSSGSVSTDLLSSITGFADFTNNDQVASLLGVVVVDPLTIRIDLDQPFGDLPLLLGNPTFGVVHYATNGQTYSTGPFMVSQTPDPTHVDLTKSPGSAANLDAVNVTYFTDANASYEAFQRNDVDWTPVSPEKADEAGKAFGVQLFKSSLRTLYLSFNLTNPAFASATFRSAIVQAIDRNAVVSALGPGSKELNGIVPDGIPGQAGAGCGAACSYDVNHAKTLLAQAFPNGGVPPLTITVQSGQPFTDAATARIVSDVAAIGVTATVSTLPADQFSNFTVDPSRQVFQTSWSAAYPSAGAFVQPLFQSTSPSNVSGLKDAKTDADIAAAQTAPSDIARLDDFRNAEIDVLNQTPVIPIATFPVDSVEQTRVRGVTPLPTGNFDAARAWVTKPQP
jgi:ABC-type oligopeptide transport system substrate-binding subunit